MKRIIEFTKEMFSCWGNGDKYDDELFIEHDPKITARDIADQIMKDQENSKLWESNEWAKELGAAHGQRDRYKKVIDDLKRLHKEKIRRWEEYRNDPELGLVMSEWDDIGKILEERK